MDKVKAQQLASILGGTARKARPSCMLPRSGKPADTWVVEMQLASGESVALQFPTAPMNERDATTFAAALGGEAHKFQAGEWVVSLDVKDGKVAEFQPPYIYVYRSRDDYAEYGDPVQTILL